jgi:endonuclease-3
MSNKNEKPSYEQNQKTYRTMLELLETTYPDAHCEFNFSNPFELLIATILSAQATNKKVNQITEQLE